MDVVEGLPDEFVLLRRELARITDRRFARGLVHPLEAVLMGGQCSLSAIYRLGDTHLRRFNSNLSRAQRSKAAGCWRKTLDCSDSADSACARVSGESMDTMPIIPAHLWASSFAPFTKYSSMKPTYRQKS